MAFTQANVYLGITTPLGTDKLILKSFQGEEFISAPFHFSVEMFSSDANIDFKKIVGKPATIRIAMSAGKDRYINGIVSRFIQGGNDLHTTSYHAELRPWLWLLRMTRDSRIFQNKTVPQIIEALFSDNGFKDYKNKLKATYAPRDYCVQYQESAYDFVSRLMEEEGIFYFFEHASGRHTLILADDMDAHTACPGGETARIGSNQSAPDHSDLVTECFFERQMVSDAYAMTDYNFEIPSTDLFVKVAGQSAKRRVFDYPGRYAKKDKGEKRARVRIEALEQPQETLRGAGRVRGFTAGHKFKLSEHDRRDLNGSYVLRWVSHSGSDENYSNTFEAFPAKTPFRPPLVTPRPHLPGPQTAMVVGKSGEEIWTDKYGRVKVHFHWDQRGKKNENSSCWVRVAQGWAGKGFGSFFLPRIGQEVVVSFLDGDPDRPLVTGSVYNAQQTVPYALPGDQTKSTVKSNSVKGGKGFNEIRFEDKKDAEEIFVQAQKDMKILVKHDRFKDVQHDEKMTIKNSRTTTIEEKDDTLIVKKGKRIIKVETGDETHEVKGKRTLTIGADEKKTNQAKYTQLTSGDYKLKIDGNLTIEASGKITIKAGTDILIKSGTAFVNQAGTDLTNKAGMNLTNKAGMNLDNKAGMNLSNKAGINLVNEASVQMTNKGGAMQTVDGGGMLTLKGGLVKIN